MWIADVTPLATGVLKQNLSYFTAQKIQPGAIVLVSVRNKNTKALVVGVREASELRANLRGAGYPLKKIERLIAHNFFLPDFIEAADLTAKYYVGNVGQILKTTVPKVILEKLDKLGAGNKTLQTTTTPPNQKLKPEKLIVQDNDEERVSFYKSLVREEFARGQSVFLCLPTINAVTKIASSLERGIKEHTVLLHNNLAAKTLVKSWQDATSNPHPILVVATPLFLSLPRSDIKTIIIDQENSGAYKARARPFGDIRKFAEYLSGASGARLIFGDLVLRTETVHRVKQGDLLPQTSQRNHLPQATTTKTFLVSGQKILSDEILDQLSQSLAKHERTFIFAHHRGLTPLTICQDCGDPLICKHCLAPLTLHYAQNSQKDRRIFVCHHCGETLPAATKCAKCHSWRLLELGVGVEKITSLLRTYLPKTKIFQLASDQVKTAKQAETIATSFYSSAASVLVGTEMALFYLKDKVENTLAVSIDSLLALPDFRAREKVMNLLLSIRSLSLKRFGIQTRFPDRPLYQQALHGNLLEFYKQEIADRETYNYPPFRLLIKVRLRDEKEKTTEAMGHLAEELEEYSPIVFPAFHPKSHGRYQLNLILKLKPDVWPEPKLLELFQNLSPKFEVEVDPTSLLN